MSHEGGSRYGGNTSCMTVESGGSYLIVDAGSGLMLLNKKLSAANPDYPRNVKYNFLLSHLHYDHIIGFGTFPPVWERDNDIKIYTCSRNEKPLNEQIFGIFEPPYWPRSLLSASGAKFIEVWNGVPFEIDGFKVRPFAANHANKTISFEITDGKKTFVHLLDSEMEGMEQALYDELLEVCTNADLVVFDSAYSKEDYPKLKGWGHSTVEQGVALAKICKPKRMLFSHFGQQYDDAELDSWARFFEGETEFIMGTDGTVVNM